VSAEFRGSGRVGTAAGADDVTDFVVLRAADEGRVIELVRAAGGDATV
jgi:hypothetical protein